MVYDKMKWHYDGDYPEDLPKENAGTHMGFFITWCIDNNLMGQEILKDCGQEIQQVKDRVIDGRAFLMSVLDETFAEDALNEEGQKFTAYYYEDMYYDDLFDTLFTDDLDSSYHIDNSWSNCNVMKDEITRRYGEWKNEN